MSAIKRLRERLNMPSTFNIGNDPAIVVLEKDVQSILDENVQLQRALELSGKAKIYRDGFQCAVDLVHNHIVSAVVLNGELSDNNSALVLDGIKVALQGIKDVLEGQMKAFENYAEEIQNGR